MRFCVAQAGGYAGLPVHRGFFDQVPGGGGGDQHERDRPQGFCARQDGLAAGRSIVRLWSPTLEGGLMLETSTVFPAVAAALAVRMKV